MPNNKLLLTIAGQSILINTNEDESYAKALAEEIDEDISIILHANTGASVTNSALLCAIDYLDTAKKATKNANNMRNQVKDYLDDAAKAKFKYDEEHKRANELTGEISSLRAHLTRLATEGDSSGVLATIKADLAQANAELEEIRDKATKIAEANTALTEKSTAMSDYISGQDKEISRSNSIVTELYSTIAKKDEQLSALATRIEMLSTDSRTLKSENARLNTEMYTIEQAMTKEHSITKAAIDELAVLRDTIEELQMENEIAQEEIAQLKSTTFSPSAIFDQPLSDELEQTQASPTPILFDYEADTDSSIDGQFSHDALNLTLSNASEFELSINEVEQADEPEYVEDHDLDSPEIFDGFRIVDDFNVDSIDTDQIMGISSERAIKFNHNEESLFKNIDLELDHETENENPPDLSWTLEI